MEKIFILLFCFIIYSCNKEEIYFEDIITECNRNSYIITNKDSIINQKLLLLSGTKYIKFDGDIIDSITVNYSNDSLIWIFEERNLLISDEEYSIKYSENITSENLYSENIEKSLIVIIYSNLKMKNKNCIMKQSKIKK